MQERPEGSVQGAAVGFAPGGHRVEEGEETLAEGGEGVFHGRGLAGQNGTDEEPVGLQRAETLGEHLLADPGEGAMQGAETDGPGEDQFPQDEELPLAADEPNRNGDGTGREF